MKKCSCYFKKFIVVKIDFIVVKPDFIVVKTDFTVVKTDFTVVKTNFTVVKKYFQTLCLESSSLTLTVHSSVAWSCYVGNYQRSQLHESAKKYMLDVISLVKKL